MAEVGAEALVEELRGVVVDEGRSSTSGRSSESMMWIESRGSLFKEGQR